MAVQVNSFFGQLQSLADTAELDEKIGFFPISPTGNVGTFIPDQSNALVAFKTGDAKREAGGPPAAVVLARRRLRGLRRTRSPPVSLQTGVDVPADVPQALLDVSASLGDSVGSMQALAVANPDLYLNLGDMIQGTKTPDEVAEATQEQFAELAKAHRSPRLLIHDRGCRHRAGTPAPTRKAPP